MQNILLWTKTIKENGKRQVDFQVERPFFHLVVSVIFGNTAV